MIDYILGCNWIVSLCFFYYYWNIHTTGFDMFIVIGYNLFVLPLFLTSILN